MTALLALSQGAFAHEPDLVDKAAQGLIDAAAVDAVAVVDAFSAALRTGDLSSAGKLLVEDVLILESGGAEHSREEYLGGHAKSDAAFLKDAHVQTRHRSARSGGDMVWVATESELHAITDGKPLNLRSTETMVLRKLDGHWRIVHIHWSSRTQS